MHLLRYSTQVSLAALTPAALTRLAERLQRSAAADNALLADQCRRVAEHMRTGGVEQALAYACLVVDSVDLRRFVAGQPVRIPAGIAVHTAGPVGERVTRRARSVVLHRAYAGYEMGRDTRQPTLVWAGAGGYWNQVALEDVLQAEVSASGVSRR